MDIDIVKEYQKKLQTALRPAEIQLRNPTQQRMLQDSKNETKMTYREIRAKIEIILKTKRITNEEIIFEIEWITNTKTLPRGKRKCKIHEFETSGLYKIKTINMFLCLIL